MRYQATCVIGPLWTALLTEPDAKIRQKKTNKKSLHQYSCRPFLILTREDPVRRVLCGVDRFYGADVCTSTAVSAYVRVNFVDITLRNSINRAFVNATAACSAIFIDNVSHLFVFFGF